MRRPCALGKPNLIPVCPLDLAHPEHIPGVVATVQRELAARGKQGLYAVIHNAGGGGITPLETTDLEMFSTEMQARIVGPVALMQAVLPMIRTAQGRVLWIVTPALMPIPYVTSIHAADYAVNCIANTFHMELSKWNIPNILIACGGINTPSPERSLAQLRQMINGWSPEQKALYGDQMERALVRFADFDEGRTEPEAVAQVIFKALVSARPKRRYPIGKSARIAKLVEIMPQPVVDSIFMKMA